MQIYAINQKKVFNLREAQSLLPVIYRITEESQKEVKTLVNQLEASKHSSKADPQIIQSKIDEIVDKWHQKVQKLGATPKGLWLADFDHGTGYYCWKFPEPKIRFCHGYSEGFSGRMLIEDEQSISASTEQTLEI